MRASQYTAMRSPQELVADTLRKLRSIWISLFVVNMFIFLAVTVLVMADIYNFPLFGKLQLVTIALMFIACLLHDVCKQLERGIVERSTLFVCYLFLAFFASFGSVQLACYMMKALGDWGAYIDDIWGTIGVILLAVHCIVCVPFLSIVHKRMKYLQAANGAFNIAVDINNGGGFYGTGPGYGAPFAATYQAPPPAFLHPATAQWGAAQSPGQANAASPLQSQQYRAFHEPSAVVATQ